VEQKSHAFPFGSCISCSKFTSEAEDYKAYQEFFLEYFRWATPENAMKWRFMQPMEVTSHPLFKSSYLSFQQNRVEYSLVDRAIAKLKENK
jgi:endo-1,4-beta-xylanase